MTPDVGKRQNRETDMTITVRNECAVERIALSYRPIVDEAIAAYREIVGDCLMDVRLLGSVARGSAVAGQSDIDFMGILTAKPPDTACTALQNRARFLLVQHPIVSKIDLDVVVSDQIHPTQRFILATDSVSLLGEDFLTEREVTIEAVVLAELVTPNLRNLLPSYVESVRSSDERDLTTLFHWSRWCGKDILKCLRGVAIRREWRYEREIGKIHEQLQRCFPEHSVVLQAVFSLYSDPQPDKTRILDVLQRVQEVFLTIDGEQNAEHGVHGRLASSPP